MKCLETRITNHGFKRRRYIDDSGDRHSTIEVPMELWKNFRPDPTTISAWGASTDLMLKALEELGRATRAQLQKVAGISSDSAGQAVTRLMRVSKTGASAGKRRIHIADWTREHEGAREYLRAVYALGDAPDARRPKPKSRRQVKRDSAERANQWNSKGADLQNAWLNIEA